MKNIFKSISLIAAVSLVFAACNKEAPSKAEVEKDFTAISGTLPSLSLDENVTIDFDNLLAAAVVTISGLDTSLDSLSVGVLVSAKDDFSTTSFAEIENPTDGDFTVSTAVSPNKTLYMMAVAASTIGTVYSNVVEVVVPDVPFYKKIAGIYSGKMVSAAYGDEYDNFITIISDPDDPENSCFIQHLEPYYYKKYAQYGYPNFFFVQATIDNDAKTISVAVGADYHFPSDAGLIIAGFNSSDYSTATANAPITFNYVDDETLLQVEGFTPMSPGDDGKYAAEDAYNGNVTWKKQQ